MVSTSDVYVAILLLFAQSVVASTTFGLNRDWRFLLSDVEPSSCSLPDPFPFDANNKCMGLQPALYASSPETCLDSCCADDSCEIWQWCDGTSGCGDVGCLIGKKTTCDDDQEGWVGGYRSTLPPPPTPSSTCNLTLTPECGEDFDDGAWRILDIPHDYVVEGKVDQEKGDMSHGYLPVGKAWYRKHFSTPQVSDQQELAYLQFEGIMGAIEVYCTSEVDTVGSLPSMTYVPDARLKATMKSASSNEDVAERCVNVEVFHEGRGSASYTLEEVEIVKDYQPQPWRPWVGIEEGWDSIELALQWESLPSIEECPVLVWDPVFHALPASRGTSDDGDLDIKGGGSNCVKPWFVVSLSLVVVLGATII